jgi:oxygen-independent coproporphyrinogen III oxidase
MLALNLQLKNELKKTNRPLKSIFIGGGTPSSVEGNLYDEIFISLRNFIDKNTEITIEANPNSTTKEWLVYMKNLGVTRLSFGVQSFNNEKLKFLGRNHTKEMAIQSVELACETGFKDINIDIIYDTSIDTKELIDNDLAIIKTLPINHISAYSLTIEEGTKFFKKPNSKIENIKMAQYIFDSLKNFGFTQYEISNFSTTKDARSKHNFGYWEKEDYLGVGAGAVGCIGNTRYYPQKDVQNYINNPLSYEESEQLEDDDVRFERIFLGLRSLSGVPLYLFCKKELEKIEILKNENKIYILDETLFNCDFLLSDEIVLFITD